MIKFKTIKQDLLEGIHEIPYKDAHKIFSALYRDYKHKFLLESKDVSEIYGRLSLIGVDPCLKVSGKNQDSQIEPLNNRSELYAVDGEDIIRELLKENHIDSKSFLGLYGAFSYDFIRLFEDIGDSLPENNVNDFTLFLYDTFVLFDHLKEKCEIIVYRENTQEIEKVVSEITQVLETSDKIKTDYKINDPSFCLSQKEYEELVVKAKKYAEEGELFEVVFSNILKANFEGDPFALYLKYREENPSPYLFYFDFGEEQLVGASPEMMIRCENGIVNLRPISGTAMRGCDPVKDHENMLHLLSDEKERAELDMLIDLGRNDLSRVCKPGIKITDYRFVEKYSKVMHTVAHLSGELQEGLTAFDALIASLNAGTLTGAPKVAAMQMIEKHEKERRGYYGGTVGYLTFSGDMDTGIIIRTAHIRDGKLRFQVGATLLYDSVPSKEYQETLNKAAAFLETFSTAQGSKAILAQKTNLARLSPPGGRAPIMKKILVIDNFDSFTFNLVDYFKQLECDAFVHRNNINPDLIKEIDPDLIVISPGPSVPKNAGNLMKIIEKYHEKYPMFGVCLGHEAFIEYFGGSLKFVKPVHGKSSKIHHDGRGVFKGLEQDFAGGRYHSLVADKVPDCFEISAKSEGLVMAIRHKTLPIIGVQFHPESILTMRDQCGFKIIKNLLT
ncbi:MAG: chorismate-binding protein [Patescibacteria group bacterium]|nr:chorismate-binding protein [Patescibacteria group bacterium]